MAIGRLTLYLVIMRFSFIPLALLVVPVIEISIFVMIGQHIGVLGTVAGVVLTAVIGSLLLRFQGFKIFGDINRQLQAGGMPARAMGDAALIVVAALLLLTPGFLTDAVGFSLFIPQVRAAIWSFVAKRITVVGPGGVRFGQGGPETPDFGFEQSQDPRADVNPEKSTTIDLDADDYEDQTGTSNFTKQSGSKGAGSPWNKPLDDSER
ncbi:MAG: FxsA family protein [Pseudomonadota bacterium]